MFPRENHKRFGNKCCPLIESFPTSDKINTTIKEAVEDAIKTAAEFGMVLESNETLYNISIPAIIETEDEDEITVDQAEDLSEDLSNSDAQENELQGDALPNEFDKSDQDSDQEFVSQISKLDSLNLKDCSNTKFPEKSCLTVELANGKIVKVKKSTLCWFFQNKKGRLSSDRLVRVRGMTEQKKRKNTNKQNKLSNDLRKNKKTLRKTNEEKSETETETESESLDSSFTNSDEISDENEEKINSDEEYKDLIIHEEKIYAVFYDEDWYLGRVIEIYPEEVKVKFLRKTIQKSNEDFTWAHKHETYNIKKKYLFHGPINLIGNDPFSLKRSDKLQVTEKYKSLKKIFSQ